MSAIAGLLSLTSTLAANGGNADELANEWQETIFVRNSRGYNVGTSLFGLMSRLTMEPADNLEYNWFERDPIRKSMYTQAAVDATSATLSLGSSNTFTTVPADTSWAWLLPGTILLNDTSREYVMVTNTPSAYNTVNVRRNVSFTTNNGFVSAGAAATVLAGDTWTIVTLGKGEGATAVSAVYDGPATLTNYIQTFNSTVEITNAFKGSVLRSDLDGPLQDRRIQALEKIGRDIELAFLLGARRKNLSANVADGGGGVGYQYFTGGIYTGLLEAGLGTTNVFTTGATTAITTFNNFLASVLPFGSETKLCFCGPTAYAAISNFANSQSAGYRIMQNENVFGMAITEIQTPFGSIGLTQHPLMREAVGLTKAMFIVDVGMLVQKTFEKLFLEPNIQNFGQDSYKEQYRAKLGLKMKFPQAFGVAIGVTAFTA